MSIVAIVPVAQLVAANAALELAGFGPRNFTVAAYGATGATHAALHAWEDAALRAALALVPGVVVNDAEDEGDPITLTAALIAAQGAKWGAKVEEAPKAGYVEAGDMLKEDGSLWSVIQRFDRGVYSEKLEALPPALVRRLRDPQEREKWVQPLDKYGAYMLVNTFTGKPDECIHNGKFYRTKVDVNVWEPAVGQLWEEIDAKGNVVKVIPPPVEQWPAWKQPAGGHDVYKIGDKVTFGGKRYVSKINANVWSPTGYPAGWTLQP